MRKTWKRLISAVLTVSLISSFNVSKITFAENISTDGIVIDENNFPDNIFQNYVKDNFDTNKDGKLSEEEISNVESVNVKWLKIKNLKGIEYFKNIKYINAEMNYIEELDLSKNTNLVAVYCNNNMLKSIRLPNESANYTLEYLDIFSNVLTEVDLHNLKGLTFLHIDDNRITNLDLSDNPLTADHGFVAQNNYMQKIILPNNGKKYEWVEYLGTQLFPKDKSKGYKVEWYLDEEKTQILNPETTKEITLNGQTLYAEYVPIEYTVKFNPGMGLGESITQEFKYGISQNLLKNQFTKEGYEFAGWKDENGKIYSDEQEVINLTDNDGKVINLTATWEKIMLNSTITITTESLDKVYDGVAVKEPEVQKSGSTNKVVFTWYQMINDEWTKLSSAPINAGKYKVVASVAADDNHKAASAEKEFEISKAIPKYENIENLKATYGDKLENIKLPEGFSWQEDLTTSVGNVGENKFKVKYTPKDTENYEVVENIEVIITVEKSSNIWIVEPSIEGWKTGEEVKNPVGQSKFGEIEFTYSNLENGIFTKEVPTEAGTWYMKATVIGNENYSDLSTVKKFVISKNTNEWIEELNIKNWTYGEDSIDPTAKSKYGNVEFTYSNSKDGIFTSTVPSNAGTWYVKATVKATEDYTGLESIKEFEILKAIPQYDKIENLKATYGDTLENVKLPEGFSWQEDLTTSVGNAGENKFKVKYTPKDTENYEVVENIEVIITVEKATNTWIVEPSIEGWKYGEASKNPVGQSKFGEIEFTYSNLENGIFTKEVPTEAGTWYIKATVIGNENYTGLEKVMSFVIEEVKNDNVDNENQETDDETTKPDDEITKPGEEEKPSEDQKPNEEEKPNEEQKPSEEVTPDEEVNPSEDNFITEVPTIKPNDKNDIIVNTEEDIKSVEVVIKDIEAIKNGTGSLNISINSNLEINLPLSLIDKKLLEDAKNISVKINVLEDSDIIKDLKAVNKVFNFELVINGENESTSVHNFKDGIAEITFALTDEDLEGLNRDKLKVYYYNEETEKFEGMETKVEGNNVIFKTSHFSKYIISEEILDNNVDESSPDDNTTQDKDEEDINKPNIDNSIIAPDKNEEVTINSDIDNTEINNQESDIEEDKEILPSTGQLISSDIIMLFALLLVLAGGFIFFRNKEKVNKK